MKTMSILQVKTFLKRWVFNLDLKISSLSADLTTSGSLLNKKGAEYENDLPPYVTRLKVGWCNKIWLDDRSTRVGSYFTILLFKYSGARLQQNTLYANKSTLNSILSTIGSQWSSFKIRMMWSIFLVRVTIRAAVFWMFWRRCICVFGIPYRRELQ